MKKPQRLIFLMLGIIVFATVTATAAGDDLAQIAASRPIPRDRVALAEAFGRGVNLPRVARTAPLAVKLGDTQKFWVSDPSSTQNRQIEARLRYIGKHILMYVDTTLNPNQALIERSAKRFEEQIYPRDRALFGNDTSNLPAAGQ